MFHDLFSRIRKALSGFFENRVLVLGVFLLPMVAVLFVRLFELQIVRGEDYYENYLNTTKKEVSVAAMRGNIYDRKGVLLAGNRVVYNVTIRDENYYTKSDGEFNEMLLRLTGILEKYGASIVSPIPVTIDENGLYQYTGSDSKRRQFIRDVYGKEKIELSLSEKGIDLYEDDAETVMTYLQKNLYNFSKKWKRADSVSKEDALKICNIRYALSATAFTRYISTVISGDVSQELQAAVLESQTDLYGVMVEESYERVYYDSECFSGILGYVGSITTEEIEELNAQGGEYIGGDVIGKEGIESAYESELQGKKGKKLIYVNNVGIVMHEEMLEEPQQGNDVWLSVDAETMVAAYHIIEQQLAGIIVNHLYEGTDYDPEEAYLKSDYKIPVRDVYFQMINNHILSVRAFAEEDASFTEREMDRKMQERKAQVTAEIRSYMERRDPQPLADMETYMQAYISYLYSFLSDEKYLLTQQIDTKDETYQKWKQKEISLPDFLLYALKTGWIDMSRLSDSEERYSTVDTCYAYLIDLFSEEIQTPFMDFDKLVYDELIHKDVISGCEIAAALFEQGILTVQGVPENDKNALRESAVYRTLLSGGNEEAAAFFREKITEMELKPSQIALDPCSAGLVLMDPNTGELLAVVSYPGYDSNRINDSAYYSELINDLSSPLYSRATQSKLAPGSTFKMVTATAALEGGYVGVDEYLVCEGIYDKLDNPKCWIYRSQGVYNDLVGHHGAVSIVQALGQSCNCFFYECGYRFSLNGAGLYSPSQGISVLNEYAKRYGFGTLTGIEVTENVSTLTDELPVTSAIGQGTYAFTTISLARYVTALASSGNVYECRLLKKVTDRNANVLLSYEPQIIRKLEFSDAIWDAIHRGMYTVVHDGGSRNGDYDSLLFDYAAKSGSAQENPQRPEHGWYVTYGPYESPEYAMAVQIPNGYSSGNAGKVAAGLYEFLEGSKSLQEIKNDIAPADTQSGSFD